MADNSIVLRNITKRYGVGGSGPPEPGDILPVYFLLGPSGCGKTTTSWMIGTGDTH